MKRVVTATEAKNRLGSLMSEVLESNDSIIIELRGRPKIALVKIERLTELEEIETRQRHERAIASFDALTEKIAARKNGLSEEEAMALAVEVVREIRAEKVAGRRNQAAIAMARS